jgi:hypothetical protein
MIRDLLHSAQESRVAPPLRFLAGSGLEDGSRLLVDEVDIGVRMGNEEVRTHGVIKVANMMSQVRLTPMWSDLGMPLR